MEDKVLNAERTIELLKRDIEDQNSKYRELYDTMNNRNTDFDNKDKLKNEQRVDQKGWKVQ